MTPRDELRMNDRVRDLENEVKRLHEQLVLVSKILECLIADDGK